jgi:enoyl-CoA hydratase/carnithine racemase
MGQNTNLVVVTRKDGVATLRFNLPKRLNGWTVAMKAAIEDNLEQLAADDDVGAVILTGTGDYYSAGVDLGGALQPGHPRELRRMIIDANQKLFDLFIDYPKPLIAAVNGHAIGATVTTATLCDAILAAPNATFSTPFAKVGLPAEGCSSVLFPRLLGHATAERILGAEGWKPTAEEALNIGLIEEVVPGEQLLNRAQELASSWVAEGRGRVFKAQMTADELKRINAEESVRIADGFLSPAFMMNQYRFLKARNKTGPALTFLALRLTRPVWSLLL